MRGRDKGRRGLARTRCRCAGPPKAAPPVPQILVAGAAPTARPPSLPARLPSPASSGRGSGRRRRSAGRRVQASLGPAAEPHLLVPPPGPARPPTALTRGRLPASSSTAALASFMARCSGLAAPSPAAAVIAGRAANQGRGRGTTEPGTEGADRARRHFRGPHLGAQLGSRGEGQRQPEGPPRRTVAPRPLRGDGQPRQAPPCKPRPRVLAPDRPRPDPDPAPNRPCS